MLPKVWPAINTLHANIYESGGPTDNVLGIWKAGAKRRAEVLSALVFPKCDRPSLLMPREGSRFRLVSIPRVSLILKMPRNQQGGLREKRSRSRVGFQP
jgi:hypothetical protein